MDRFPATRRPAGDGHVDLAGADRPDAAGAPAWRCATLAIGALLAEHTTRPRAAARRPTAEQAGYAFQETITLTPPAEGGLAMATC